MLICCLRRCVSSVLHRLFESVITQGFWQAPVRFLRFVVFVITHHEWARLNGMIWAQTVFILLFPSSLRNEVQFTMSAASIKQVYTVSRASCAKVNSDAVLFLSFFLFLCVLVLLDSPSLES